MSGIVLRLQLFAVSYVPLALILMFRTLPDWSEFQKDRCSITTPAIFLGIGLAGIALCWRLLRMARMVSGVPTKIIEVRDQGANAAGYLATYIFPFILFDSATWQVWAANAAYMATLMLVTVRSNLVLVNPTLYAFGRQVVEIRVAQQRVVGQDVTVSAILICKHVPHPGDELRLVTLADGYMEKT